MATVVDSGMVIGKAAEVVSAGDAYRTGSKDSLSPAMSLTNICIVSSTSTEEAREMAEEMEDMLLERMMAVVAARVGSRGNVDA